MLVCISSLVRYGTALEEGFYWSYKVRVFNIIYMYDIKYLYMYLYVHVHLYMNECGIEKKKQL